MIDKLITGATAYRVEKAKTEWFVVKADKDSDWELPKSSVRRGESSVSALIRAMQEEIGIKGRVIEEAGRTSLSKIADGEAVNEKLLFYVVKISGAEDEKSRYSLVRWAQYGQAKKLLSLVREQKMLEQAQEVLKQCRKENKKL